MPENTELLIENLKLQAENLRLRRQLDYMNNLAREMYYQFRFDRPNLPLKEKNRESLELKGGGTLYMVQYVDTKGNSFISTEGFTPEGDIAPKLFYFGYAVFFLVEELTRQGFTCLPDRFLELLSRNQKFLRYVLKEFQRVLSL
ncbi:hypothetical protein QUB05_04660 [Microcoleus sp. F10-C6]|jgi:hypothetical protein|uniref:hypothetical protein n=1 Tax=unclassified Microcoleus TaxID=2642155 RepID=UPI002FD3CA17